jgi:hypothetical protein
MNTISLYEQVSLIHARCLPHHSVSTHLMRRWRRFITLPLSATAFPFAGLDFTFEVQARRRTRPYRVR